MAVNDDSFRRWPDGLQFPAVNFGIDQGGAFAKYGETQIGRLRQSRQGFQGKIANAGYQLARKDSGTLTLYRREPDIIRQTGRI